jgi:hypothetical protein
MSDVRARRHRGLFWLAGLLGAVALIGGGVYAYFGYSAASGPDGAVRGYFAALARADAPAALAYGPMPAGSRGLLTSTVLREQERIAPLRSVHILGVAVSGSAAAVSVSYQLDFATGVQAVTANVGVDKHDGSWRLTNTAVSTTLQLRQARQRATLGGAALPSGPTLLFPGAIPIEFDSPYLQLDPRFDTVRLGGADDTKLTVDVTAAGRTAIGRRLTAALRKCVGAGVRAGRDCPLPSARVIPGSLSGALADHVADNLRYQVGRSPSGLISVSGTVPFHGTFRRLTFDNVPVVAHGSLRLPVTAYAYAVVPLDVRFRSAG